MAAQSNPQPQYISAETNTPEEFLERLDAGGVQQTSSPIVAPSATTQFSPALAFADKPPEIGDVLTPINQANMPNETRYRVEHILGWSHIGRVFIAQILADSGRRETGGRVVVKEFRSDYFRWKPVKPGRRAPRAAPLSEDDFARYWKREWETSQEVRRRLSPRRAGEHSKLRFFLLPENVMYYDIDRPAGEVLYIVYMTSPYIEGSMDLRTFLDDELFPYTLRTHEVGQFQLAIANLAYLLMRMVSMLHQSGIVHHDIKPRNIVVVYNNRAAPSVTDVHLYLIDWGSACVFADPSGLFYGPNNQSYIRCQWPYSGTPNYDDPTARLLAKPAQKPLERRVTEFFDIYACAVTINDMADLNLERRRSPFYAVIILDMVLGFELSGLYRAMPRGMFNVLEEMTQQQPTLMLRPSAADASLLFERIRDSIDVSVFIEFGPNERVASAVMAAAGGWGGGGGRVIAQPRASNVDDDNPDYDDDYDDDDDDENNNS
jgi:serine/threonine protein kinase